MKIYPSLISSDILSLRDTLHNLNTLCDGYHLDVMDDHFVPNLTWGPAFIKAISKETTLPLQIHLMVDDPHAWVSRLSLRAHDTFIFHYETILDIEIAENLIDEVKENNMRVGIALNPETFVDEIAPLLKHVDEVLVMSVNPGFSGQDFIDMTSKVKQLALIRERLSYSFVIAMDGGINADNISMLKKAGVEIVGVASAIFLQEDYSAALNSLKQQVQCA